MLLKDFFFNLKFEKSQQTTKILPRRQRFNTYSNARTRLIEQAVYLPSSVESIMADNTNKAGSSRKTSNSFHCCVPLCTSDSRYDASLHFHRIPSSLELRKQWILRIRRDEGPFFKVSLQFFYFADLQVNS